LIRFVHNQNLPSPKAFDLLRLCEQIWCSVTNGTSSLQNLCCVILVLCRL